MIRQLILIAILVSTVSVIFFIESRKPERTIGKPINIVFDSLTKEEKAKRFDPAIEIARPSGFLNTLPVSVGELIGKKVILVDFWTYSCINCQRTLPYLNAWQEKYAKEGLVILGIHTPEFEFEKDINNVKKAVEKYGIAYPVILDNDYGTWNAYKNRYWPHKFLIDADGFIIYDHIGEGGYEETEKMIVGALNELRAREGKGAVEIGVSPDAGVTEFQKIKTPETYLGYARLENIVNLPSKECFDNECTFLKPSKLSSNTFAFEGKWKMGAQETVLTGDEGTLSIRFNAGKVNLVAGADISVRAEVYLDGKKIDTNAGKDAPGGEVLINEHDLYNLVDLGNNYGEHVLEIKFLSPGVSVYAFTFG